MICGWDAQIERAKEKGRGPLYKIYYLSKPPNESTTSIGYVVVNINDKDFVQQMCRTRGECDPGFIEWMYGEKELSDLYTEFKEIKL